MTGKRAAPAPVLLGSLYFSQGLPFGFFTQALPVMLRQQGWALGEIGLSSLLALPWALKFLWAPLVDRHSLPELGRRRSWILPLQVLGAGILAALAGFSAQALGYGAHFSVAALLSLAALVVVRRFYPAREEERCA
jgi:hypothetical protein